MTKYTDEESRRVRAEAERRRWEAIESVMETDHYDGDECQKTIEKLSRHWALFGSESVWNLGNVMKYLWRAGRKGPMVQDLEKALWYLEQEVMRMEGGR